MESMEPNNKKPNIRKLKHNSYTCNKCNKTPKILSIDYKKSIIEFFCDEHKNITLSLCDYLNSILKNDNCQICYKNVDDELKFCTNCNKKLCNKCQEEHNKEYKTHIIIKNDEYNIKCKNHEKEYYIGYCSSCKKNICNECKKTREHKFHDKFDYIEIQPTIEDMNIIKNFNLQLEKEINKYQKENAIQLSAINNEKNKEIKIISEKYKKLNEEAKIKWENTIKNYEDKVNKQKEKEIVDNNNLKNEEIKKINLKYKEKEKTDDNIRNYKGIILLNKIIVNSYIKQKEYNLYYNENIKKIIESINLYNRNYNKQSLDEIKEKYKILLAGDNKILNIKDNKIDNEIINTLFTYDFSQLKEIFITSNSLTSIEFLTKNKFEELEKIVLKDCPINDISILSNSEFNSLKELKINYANLVDITPVIGENFKNLKILNLNGNKIKDISFLQFAKFNENLLELSLNNNKISDISVFKECFFCKLKNLSLSYNNIKDISFLDFILINCCESLSLDNNQIKRINIFKNVKRFFELKNLSLSNNPIDFNSEENKIIKKLILSQEINLY